MMITKNFSCQSLYEKKELSSGRASNAQPELPGRHVIHNILNYARSLEVMKKNSGEPFYLLKN